MNGFADRQRGLSAIGLLVVLVVGLSLVVMGIRLVPVYLESLEVGSIIESVADDPAMRGASRADIRRALDRRFSVNTIRGVSRDDITFAETATGIEIVVDYEVRVPLIGNLDAVAKFRKSAVVPQ
ncbi:MAG: DUF4845 domain-containing protein [Ectothiorhodospiraceae bacterium]|nr:DUF4845 domain-containing protein [Ectothiorhodospiraceae bacterium]